MNKITTFGMCSERVVKHFLFYNILKSFFTNESNSQCAENEQMLNIVY